MVEQTLIGGAILVFLWGCVSVFGHGYFNTVDWIAYHLHQYAVRGHARQLERATVMLKLWNNEKEKEKDAQIT